MRHAAGLATVGKFLGIVAVMVCWFSAFPILVNAQGTPGQNAVCSSATGCSTQAGSSAFIDASMFPAQGRDFCAVLKFILTPINHLLPASGGVIDARGLPGTTGTNMTCMDSPWGSGSSYLNVPSTILLPAGTITIPSTWILPNGTKLIGEETTNPSLNIGNSVLQTTLQATNGFSSGAMIQFGDSNCPQPACAGVSLESLTLYGNNNTINGIQNQSSQDLSYVDHVTLYHVLGIGLLVSGSAQNSGPYSNINYDTGGAGVSSSTCAQILGLTGTRGIHGLSCLSSPESQNAVLLDSSSNTLEEIRIVGFYNGIQVGSNAAAHSNVLRNIAGDTTVYSSPPNVVHISKTVRLITPFLGALTAHGAESIEGGTTLSLRREIQRPDSEKAKIVSSALPSDRPQAA